MTGGTEANVADTEVVSRFILKPRWLRANNQVRDAAFEPPRSNRLSVTRSSLLNEDRLWLLGRETATARSGNESETIRLVGRADLRVADVIQIRPLRVVQSPLPSHPEHADVVGWPESKSERMVISKQLAANARFVPCPSQIT
jgi:hypothetical protein